MYKLVIADDEYRTRLGLKSYIDWESLGFEVSATFDDGDDLLKYLEEHKDVDVILTDIKMERVGGIQIAETVKNFTPAPRIVFISGYKQLDYAMAAIENNVLGYIFKPIDHSKLKSLFTDIKNKLDEENHMRQIMARHSTYQEKIANAKECFFADMLTNTSSSKAALLLFQVMYPTLSFDDCLCFEVILKFSEYNRFTKHIWPTTKNDLYAALYDSIKAFHGSCEYWLTSKQNNLLFMSAICKPGEVPADEGKFIQKDADTLARTLTQNYETPIKVFSIRTFRGIPTLASTLYSQELHSNNNAIPSNVIEQVKEYIRAHIEEDISLETISARFFLSQAYLSKLFKNTTGENFVDFIIREKMEYAKLLLNDPTAKIYEVAERVGYKSVSHFNKQFKKSIGMKPSEYRRN